MDSTAPLTANNSRSHLAQRMRDFFVTANSGHVSLASAKVSLPSFKPQVTAVTDGITQAQALEILDQVLTEVEQTPSTTQTEVNNLAATPVLDSVPAMGAMAVTMPQVVQQATDTLNPGYGGGVVKEKIVSSQTLEQPTDGMSGGGVATEYEPEREMEIPVEVESYLEKVTQHQDQLPQEIVVATDGQDLTMKPYPSQPVIVLPITAEKEATGAKQSPKFSFRWLVEWSRKIMKMFEGMAIYQPTK